MNIDEMKVMARQTAEAFVKRAVDGYVKSCEKYPESYLSGDCEPDADDFFAWLEGFEWIEEDPS